MDKPKPRKFTPFLVEVSCCQHVILLSKPRQFQACACGKMHVDAGDGHYWRCVGEASILRRWNLMPKPSDGPVFSPAKTTDDE